jgi:hypothetical protein
MSNLVVGCAVTGIASSATGNADVIMLRTSSIGSRNAMMLWVDGALHVEDKASRCKTAEPIPFPT